MVLTFIRAQKIAFIQATCLGLAFNLLHAQGNTAGMDIMADSLTLEAALSQTMGQNLNLAAQKLEIKALEGRFIQAGRRPIPEISLEAENFAGSGSHSGIKALETTLGMGQVFELGNKRGLRRKLSGVEKDLASWDLKTVQARLALEVQNVFVEVLAAQERLKILQAGSEVNKQILETARLRHKAGKAPATEEMKAKMAYSLNHIEIDRAAQNLRSARNRLASLWSNEPPRFKGVRGELRILPTLPSLESLQPRMLDNPDLARWNSEVLQRKLSTQAARAERIPNISVGAGIRYLHNVDNPDVAMVAGVSLPLPVPNRNLGSISEAGHRLAKAEKEKKAAEIRLLTRLRILHETLLARNEEISHLKDELLPESDRTLQASRQAYQLGKLSFLEVLDSQRILFELNSRYIATLAEYRQDWNELESLVSVNYGQVNQ